MTNIELQLTRALLEDNRLLLSLLQTIVRKELDISSFKHLEELTEFTPDTNHNIKEYINYWLMRHRNIIISQILNGVTTSNV